jgi:hypothetical protein
MVPRHEGVDVAVEPAGGDTLESSGEPVEGLDVVQLGGGENSGDGRPGFSTPVRTGEESILSRDRLTADGARDGVAVEVGTP